MEVAVQSEVQVVLLSINYKKNETMKKIIFYTIILLAYTVSLKAQDTGKTIAKTISLKMKDSLFLTDQQQGQIYQINVQIHHRKMDIWNKYRTSDSLRFYLQKTEKGRDLLYKRILSKNKYELYRLKKNNLVSVK